METEKIELTPAQEQAWHDTCCMLVWTCPGFQHLFYKLLNNNDGKYIAKITRSVPIASTDGLNISLNPDTFFDFDLPARVFIIVHEIVHNMLDDVNFMHHCRRRGTVPMTDGTTLPFDFATMNVAMDYRINAMILKSKIGGKPRDKTGKVIGCFDDKYDGTENVLDLYKKYYKAPPKGGGGGKPEDQPGGNPGGGFDQLQEPGASAGKNPDQAAQDRNPGQWQMEVAAAATLQSKRMKGDMGAGMTRMFESILAPEVPWQDHIQTLINRLTGSGGWNWQQPDEWWAPHDFFSPRRTGKGAGWIVIWGDTSGSRSDQEIASSIGEIAGMIEDVNPARITLIWCDARIYDNSIVELDEGSDLRTVKPVGGGGTSVKPVYDWINKQTGGEPDLFIGFTDGEVDFPTPPRIPIIWASSTDRKYPYGQVVRVNKRGAR